MCDSSVLWYSVFLLKKSIMAVNDATLNASVVSQYLWCIILNLCYMRLALILSVMTKISIIICSVNDWQLLVSSLLPW